MGVWLKTLVQYEMGPTSGGELVPMGDRRTTESALLYKSDEREDTTVRREHATGTEDDRATEQKQITNKIKTKGEKNQMDKLNSMYVRGQIEIQSLIAKLSEPREGQGMVEYTLILALVSIAAIAVLVLMGPQIKVILNQVQDALGGPQAT